MQHLLQRQEAKRWFEAARRRSSVRCYDGEPFCEQVNGLAALAETLARGGVRIAFLPNAGEVFGHGLLGRRITGVTHGVGFVLSAGVPDWCAGYVGEIFVLECAAQGLGTCWVLSTYRKKPAVKGVSLRPGERLAAVSPVGPPAGGTLAPMSDDDRARKSIPKLTGLTDKAFENLPEWQRDAVLCARSGPSALNRQPWFFRPTTDGLFVRGKKHTLDMGIAMLHIELAAAAYGKRGRWSEEPDGWLFRSSEEI